MRSACFTGHRRITCDESDLKSRLYKALERAVKDGNIINFYNGGAVGFDLLSAEVVLELRRKYPYITLNMILPCPSYEQTSRWRSSQRERFFRILEQADSQEIISEHYYDGCMRDRNYRLVELADCCFCYWNGQGRTGTSQTVRIAYQKKIEVLNFFEDSVEYPEQLSFEI